MKRILAMLLICVIFSSTLAACSSQKDNKEETVKESSVSSTATNDAESGDDSKTAQTKWARVYDPPIHLTQNFSTGELQVEQVPEGMSFDDNDWTKWCEETYGITWTSSWIATSREQNEQKLNLAMVSGDLPDVIMCTGKDLAPMIEGDMILSLDELIEEYGSPLLHYVLESTQEATNNSGLAPFSKEGKLYAMPIVVDTWSGSWSNNWIRNDLLKKLGKDIPVTIDDYEDILAAYKAAYPDGYGLILAAGSSDSIFGMETVMDAYGAYPAKWLKDDDGKLVYGSIQPEVKEGLLKLQEWYKNGWIDPEFVVKDIEKANETLVAGNALSYRRNWWSVWSPFSETLENDLTIDIVAHAPLAQKDGTVKTVLSPAYMAATQCFAISADCEHPEAVIDQLNVTIEQHYRNNEEVRKYMKENYDYDLMFDPYEEREPLNPEVGNPAKFTYDYPEDIEGPVFNGYGERHGMYINQGATELLDQYLKITDTEKGLLPEEDLTMNDKVEKGKYMQPQNRWPALRSSVELFRDMDEKNQVFFDEFTGAPTKGMVDNNAYLNKLELETFSQIIMGQASADTFDTFVTNWLNAGGEQITREVNEWYDGL